MRTAELTQKLGRNGDGQDIGTACLRHGEDEIDKDACGVLHRCLSRRVDLEKGFVGLLE